LAEYKYNCEMCGKPHVKGLASGPRPTVCPGVRAGSCRCKRDYLKKRNKAIYKKLCKKCWMCFETHRPSQEYCSNLCFIKRIELPRRYCAVCSRPFSPQGKKTRCCSAVCGRIKGGNTARIYELGDPRPVISKAVCDGIYKSLKSNGGSKRGRQWESLVDFTKDDLVGHLEKQFTDGMTWDNYGEWHIDHKVPVSAHNFKTTSHRDFKRCWSLKNLQPMWAKDNMSKGPRLKAPFQPSLLI